MENYKNIMSETVKDNCNCINCYYDIKDVFHDKSRSTIVLEDDVVEFRSVISESYPKAKFFC